MTTITQDAITLDYSKWAEQRRNAKLSTDHDLWRQERERVLARQQSENTEARQRYLNKLETERRAKQAEIDRQTEIELAPEKRRLQNAWLADHPNDTPADFEKKAWHHLKSNLIEQRKQQAIEATFEREKQTGRYSL